MHREAVVFLELFFRAGISPVPAFGSPFFERSVDLPGFRYGLGDPTTTWWAIFGALQSPSAMST